MIGPKIVALATTAALNGLAFSIATVTDEAASGQTVISEHSLIPLGVGVGCILFIGTVVWKVASTVQKASDRLEAVEASLSELKTLCPSCPSKKAVQP